MNVQLARYLARFDDLPGYVDFARVGPISHDVAMTLVEAARLSRGEQAVEALSARAEAVRACAARFLRAAPHEVAFATSTSHALFAAAAAFRPGTPDEGVILVRRGEFPANVYPWLRFQDRGGLRVRWIDAPRVTPENVAAHLTPDVRALTVSAVDALTGHRPPLGALKEVLGPHRVLVVDAIQGLGAVPLELDAADVLASGGQKWLRAGWGAALFLVRDRVADFLFPGLGGWPGVRDPLASDDHPREPLSGADAHAMTNPDYPAVSCLGAALDLVTAVGVEAIGARIADTLGALLDTARAAGAEIPHDGLSPGERGGIACLRLPGHDPVDVHAALARAGLTTTLRGRWIRLSPHATTPSQAVDRLAEGLRTARRP
ncbi:aminotransferase class V-fold PLP-dependent enzyme [Nonomuraea sp. NPDC059194]|uniref:aminotransferase class V-fold PLP-dependent enzyme n=1 Tax=Nonomuraea sp. NPDC059194 TaxID=3346764 RepID=UPI003675541C